MALAGYPGGIDAGDGLGALASSKVTNSVNCTCVNTGWSDPAYDKLVGDASVTYDQAERVRLYRHAQGELASQVPVVFLWRSISYDALRTAVATVDGPLDLTVPNWAWQPERMVVVSNP
jgi:ABC-type transport system substrate-binding protein